jgi:osmoprotectant transport system permease protein
MTGRLLVLCLSLAQLCCAPSRDREIRIGSKKFTESVLLGEVATQVVRHGGRPATHRAQLGGTQVVWSALLHGEVDVYPEYTGTLWADILSNARNQGSRELRAALAPYHVLSTRPLGFNNTYAIGMKESTAQRLGIRTLSDLARHPEVRLGFSEEFIQRKDCWPLLRERYQLPQSELAMRQLDHDLAYRALSSDTIDAMDLYATDAEIKKYGLRVLVDDRHAFPEYQAVLLYRADLEQRAPAAVAALRRLEGTISEATMSELNARAALAKVPEVKVAAEFLASTLSIHDDVTAESRLRRLGRRTLEHLLLVAISLLAAMVVAIPLGILAAPRPRARQLILGVAGTIQTIPSLALLAFMIPLLGIGAPPAIVALFLYSLLPIVRNTVTGLQDLPPHIKESALALGLPAGARLRLIELPLASRAIVAGIKTSAVINVGTATLGAVIGAGGLGQPILTGIRLNDPSLILEGAIPAAVLALLIQFLFEALEPLFVPRGLRLE